MGSFALAPAWALALTALAEPAVRAAEVDVAGAELVILHRDADSGSVAALWLSSAGFVGQRALSGNHVDGLWVAVEDSTWVPPFAEPRDDGPADSALAARLARWTRHRAVPDRTVAAVLRRKDMAAVRGDQCARCSAATGANTVVLSRGLAPEVSEHALQVMAPVAGDLATGVLAALVPLVERWPRTVAVRSARLYAASPGRPVQDLVVDHDRQGRAYRVLPHMRVQHVGDVLVPGLLATAEKLRRRGKTQQADRALEDAIALSREALTAYPREHVWRARLALALAMRQSRDDEAVRQMIEALAGGGRWPVVHRYAAQVAYIRGDTTAARRAIARALELDPHDAEAAAFLRALPQPVAAGTTP